MKRLGIVSVLSAAALTWAAPAWGQVRDDYLTREEVELVRKADDPDKKVQLFVDFAEIRLARLEAEVEAAGEKLEDKHRVLTSRFEEFIRSVDDISGHVEMWLDRGNADLTKFRQRLEKTGPYLVERLTLLTESNEALAESDLRYDLEDAIEATQELIALAGKIPDGMMPPRFGAKERSADSPSLPPEAGKPTLRREGEDKTGRKSEPKDKPPLR